MGSDTEEASFRVLKVDRTQTTVHLTDDHVVYTKQEMKELLAMVADGNKSTGGLSTVTVFYGILGTCSLWDSEGGKLGFVRFLESTYLLIVTKKSAIALIGGYYIYHIDDTMLYAISKTEKKPDEARYSPCELSFGCM